MCFGEFEWGLFAQYSKFRLYGIRIDENDKYHAQTDFELHACPYQLRFETKNSGGWLSHFLVPPRLPGLEFQIPILTLTLRRSRTGTVWFYTSTSNKRAARPKLYTKSLTRDLKSMYSRLTLVRISINL